MPVTRNKPGSNMYPWVTHMITHHRGECPHRCGYCYVKKGPGYRPANAPYRGPLRFELKELRTRMAEPGVYFVEHMTDLFAEDVRGEHIAAILKHLKEWPGNTYALQTKNPVRMLEYIAALPPKAMLGTTIESNRWHDVMGSAPRPEQRMKAFKNVCALTPYAQHFVTIEPILDFNPVELADWIESARPTFVNIGADSKGHGLVEPDEQDVIRLIELLTAAGIEIRQKKNLGRLIKSNAEPQ